MPETALKIKVFGDPVLRKRSQTIKTISLWHREILGQMARLMYESSGIGLAGPQVGISECLIVVDIGSGLYKLINPIIVSRQGRQGLEEGCLSVPGVCIKVKRAKKISVEARDDTGKPVIIEAEGLLACVLQHEIDHLRGKLIVDYASLLDKMRIKKRLGELRKRPKNLVLSRKQNPASGYNHESYPALLV